MKFGIRELILVSAMIALLICSYFFVFAKSNTKREALKTEIETRRQALTNLKQATSGVDDLGKKIEELQQAISFFEKKLPQEKEVDKILKEVWQMAEANSLQTKTVKTLKSERGPNYSEQPIQMNLAGDFNGFYAFLLQLEKLPRITRVSQMKLEKINERDGEMAAQLTLSIFFEPEGGSANSGNAGAASSASAR
jgi:type IV pilus assembly protein PilO